MYRLKNYLMVSLLLTVGVVPAARADLLVNGSFEGSTTPWGTSGGINVSSIGSGHATDGSSVGVVGFNVFFDNAASGTLSQSFTLLTAASVDYAFQAGRSEVAGPFNDVPLTFLARIDGITLTTLLPGFDGGSGAAPVGTSLLSSYSGTLSLAAGTHEFAFEFSQGATLFGRGPFFVLDGVSVVAQVNAVPEPSTWAMMLLGFAGVGFVAYRRGRSAPAIAVA